MLFTAQTTMFAVNNCDGFSAEQLYFLYFSTPPILEQMQTPLVRNFLGLHIFLVGSKKEGGPDIAPTA